MVSEMGGTMNPDFKEAELCFKKHNIDVLWCFSGIQNIRNLFEETQNVDVDKKCQKYV